MPNFRNIKATFVGINQQPISRTPIKVSHLSGNSSNGVEFPKEDEVFYTDENGEVNFILWCNEEGERDSLYRFTLPGDESFDAVVPVGTSDLELSVLRDGGANSGDNQYQTLISYILSQVGSGGGGSTPIASSTVAGKVKVNTTVGDPVVYFKSEVDTALTNKANTSSLTSHTSNTSNPHSVTASQVGAIPTTEKGIASGVATLDGTGKIPDTQIPDAIARDSELTTHTSRTDNPHSVTATQVGALATTTRGAANGVASLDVNTLVPDAQIPSSIARSSDLTTHTSATNNPHNTTAAQVGNSNAQWNANKIQGVDVVSTAPTNGQVLTFSSTNNRYEPTTPSGGGSSVSILPAYKPGRYYSAGSQIAASSASVTLVTNQIYYAYLPISRTVTFDRAAISVQTAVASTQVSIGIYSSLNGYDPDTLLLDTGTYDTSTAGAKENTVSITLNAGLYVVAIATSGAPVLLGFNSSPLAAYFYGNTAASNSSQNAWRVPFTYGTLPAIAINSSQTYSSISPFIFFRAV